VKFNVKYLTYPVMTTLDANYAKRLMKYAYMQKDRAQPKVVGPAVLN